MISQFHHIALLLAKRSAVGCVRRFMRLRTSPLAGAMFAVSLLLLSVLFAKALCAAEQTWVGSASGFWTHASNWDPAVPGAGDLAVVPQGRNQIWINSGELATVGSLELDGDYGDAHEIRGSGRLVVDGAGSDSRITTSRGDHFLDVRVDLHNDLTLAPLQNSDLVIQGQVNLNGHTLVISGIREFSHRPFSRDGVHLDAAGEIRGEGLVEVISGSFIADGTIAADIRTVDNGRVRPESLTILGDANIDADLFISSATNFGQISGGGGGSLNIDLLRIQMNQIPNLTEVQFDLFTDLQTLSIRDVQLPAVGAAEWDTSQLQQGILRLRYENVAACDFDVTGHCDVGELDRLSAAVRDGTHDQTFDLTADGQVDLRDRDAWLLEAGLVAGFTSAYLPGDADLSGRIDAADLMTIGLNWQFVGDTDWSRGDFNMDGRVSALDLNLLAQGWQSSLTRQADPLPEPASYLAICIVALLFARMLRARGYRLG